jgi:hypothetical protein
MAWRVKEHPQISQITADLFWAVKSSSVVGCVWLGCGWLMTLGIIGGSPSRDTGVTLAGKLGNSKVSWPPITRFRYGTRTRGSPDAYNNSIAPRLATARVVCHGHLGER